MLELATTSVVYREKVAACELLDAAIKLAIGQTNTEVKKARNVAEVKKLVYEKYRMPEKKKLQRMLEKQKMSF